MPTCRIRRAFGSGTTSSCRGWVRWTRLPRAQSRPDRRPDPADAAQHGAYARIRRVRSRPHRQDDRRACRHRGLRRDEPRLARVLPGRPAGPHHLRLAAQQWQWRRDRVHCSRRTGLGLSCLRPAHSTRDGSTEFAERYVIIGGTVLMDLKLAGKIVLITGSSRGLGWATAKAFAAEGCWIMLSARSAEQLREAEAALRRTGGEGAAPAADGGEPD